MSPPASPRTERLRRLAFEQGGALGLATLILYVALAPTHAVDGDNAEFSTLGATGGVGHPSGYPLYILYLRAMSWLPGASPAHTAAIATAILAAGSIVMLHAACRAWGARPAAAAVACAIFAAGPVVLRMYTEAEVFALNGLVVAAILWLAGPDGPIHGARRVILLGLVAGLGLANHLSCALLAPVGLVGAIRGVREHAGRKVPVVALAIGALGVGLLPYLYLLVAPSGGASWGRIDGLSALLRHFLREDYGGPGAFGPVGVHVPASASIGALVATVLRGWLWAPAAIGVGMLAVGVARGAARASWIALASSVVVAGPLLVSRFNVPPTPGVPLYVCQRFHLLTLVLLVVPVAVGIDRLVRAIAARRRLPPLRPALGAVLGVVALVGAVAPSLPGLRRAHSPALERCVENLLVNAPRDAVVLTIGDHLDLVGSYLQFARGVRPDVTMITGSMMTMRWYRDDIDAKLGFTVMTPGPGDADVRVAREILAHGRPLLIDRNYGPIAAAYPGYPHGMLVRILPEGAAPPPIAEVFAINRAIFEQLDLDYPPPRRDDDWPAIIHDEYARTWRGIARALAAAGDTDDAEWAGDLATGLAPK